MKNHKSITKLLLMLAIFVSMMNIDSKAQSNWEIGLRFGDDLAVDATIPISTRPRLHATAYLDDRFGIGTYFDWMFALEGGPKGLKFYPGVGPEFYFEDGFDFSVAGDFGAEYSFDFPLTIGLDWRPRVMVTNDSGFYGGNWGLIARFRFGEGLKFKKAN